MKLEYLWRQSNQILLLGQHLDGGTFQLYSYAPRATVSRSHSVPLDTSEYCFDRISSTDCLWLTRSVLAQPRDRHPVSKRVSCARWTLSGADVLRPVGLE